MNTNSEFQSATTAPGLCRKSLTILKIILLLACTAVTASAAEPTARVKVLMTKPLPNIPGKEATMLLVTYPPGSKDVAHRHNANAFVYVLEGSIVMQMRGSRPVTLHPGQTFYEDAKGIHQVGRNASKTAPAKFVVLLVKDKGAPILTPVTK
jgi:quercetin dioxygenase-like cupin family protein